MNRTSNHLKTVVLLAGILTHSLIVSAQSSHTISLGAGPNFSSLAFTSEGNRTYNEGFSNVSGFHTEFSFRYRKRAFAFDFSIGFSQHGGATAFEQTTTNGTYLYREVGSLELRYNYLHFAPLFGLNLDQLFWKSSKLHLRLGAGPWLGGGLGGSRHKIETRIESSPLFGVSVRTFDMKSSIPSGNNLGYMSTVAFGLIGSLLAEYDVSERVCVFVEPRYLLGVSDASWSKEYFFDFALNNQLRTLNISAGVGLRL